MEEAPSGAAWHGNEDAMSRLQQIGALPMPGKNELVPSLTLSIREKSNLVVNCYRDIGGEFVLHESVQLIAKFIGTLK